MNEGKTRFLTLTDAIGIDLSHVNLQKCSQNNRIIPAVDVFCGYLYSKLFIELPEGVCWVTHMVM